MAEDIVHLALWKGLGKKYVLAIREKYYSSCVYILKKTWYWKAHVSLDAKLKLLVRSEKALKEGSFFWGEINSKNTAQKKKLSFMGKKMFFSMVLDQIWNFSQQRAEWEYAYECNCGTTAN